ncbi:MAG: MFS transporter, partial [Verrucomicrobiota bacterium]
LGLTRVQLSAAYLMGTLSSGFSLPWLGKVLDRWGARRMIVASAAGTGAVLVYLSLVAQLGILIGQGLPAGWGTGCRFVLITLGFFGIRASAQGLLTMTSRNAIGKWFHAKRGLAVAVSNAAVSFGFAIAPLLLRGLIESYSYEGAWRILAGLLFFIMVPVGWLVFRDNPEECGMKMDDGVVLKRENPDMIIHREFTRPEALRTLPFWAFNLSLSYLAFMSTAYTFHLESIGQDAGLEASFIFRLFLPCAVISVLTSVVCGLLSMRVRLKWLLLGMNGAFLPGTLSLLYLDHSMGVIAYIIGNGIGGGCFVSLIGLVWPRFYGREHLGAISGACMSSMVIASALGPWLFALSREGAGSYQPIVWLCLLWPLVGGGMSFWADNPQRRLAA